MALLSCLSWQAAVTNTGQTVCVCLSHIFSNINAACIGHSQSDSQNVASKHFDSSSLTVIHLLIHTKCHDFVQVLNLSFSFQCTITFHISEYRCKNSLRTVYGNSSCFEVKGGMHQGSALSDLSPLLFADCHESFI